MHAANDDATFARLDVVQEPLAILKAGEDLDQSIFDDRNHGDGIACLPAGSNPHEIALTRP